MPAVVSATSLTYTRRQHTCGSNEENCRMGMLSFRTNAWPHSYKL